MKKTLLFVALAVFAAGLAFGGTITVSQPTAGDKVMGSSMQIAWTSTGVAGNFKIQLIRPGGALVGQLMNNIAASPQSWTVAAPALVGENYKIRVHAMDGSADGLSATFTVIADGGGEPEPGTITNVHLNGSSPYCFGTAYTISWTVTAVPQHLKLQLIHTGGALVGAIDSDMAPGTSSKSWTPDATVGAGTNYKVRVSTLDNAVTAESAEFELKTCEGGGGLIDPGILDKIRRMRRIVIKWPIDPDPPCYCPEFDLRELRDLMGNPTNDFKIHLLKNGVLVQELGVFGRGAVLPLSLKGKLSREDYGLLRQGGAKFSLALIGENGKIMNEVALEGGQEVLLR